MDLPSPERCASLKAHKSLPRKRVVSDELGGVSTYIKTKSRSSYTSPAKEAEIASWIRDASPPTPTEVTSTTASTTFLLPLTPPEDDMDARSGVVQSTRQARIAEEKERKPASHHSRTVSGSATPVNHYSPPTPELTPPRKIRHRTPSPPLRKKNRMSLSPPPASRQASSSKAESFRTAFEEGSPRLTSTSVNTFHTVNEGDATSPARTPQRPVGDGSVGLGLGLTEDDIRTPRVEIPRMVFSSPLPSDGQPLSKSATPNMVRTDPLVATEIPAVQALERAESFLYTGDDDDVISMSGVSYIKDDDTPYRERIFADDAARHMGDQGLAESDLSSRRSVSPISDASDLEPLASRAKVDSKRFSQVSASSIPRSVEVVIIDSSPPRQHKLRHSGKNSSLRAASSTQGGSNRSSLQSTSDFKPRLNQMLGASTFRTTGSSLYSDSGISIAGSDHIMKRWSKMRFMDMPRRAPSNTRSLPYPQPNARYASSLSSTYIPRQRSRPATAPNGTSVGSRHKGGSRTFSEASTLARDGDSSRRGRQMIPPAIPKRSSSLSAQARAEPDPPGAPQTRQAAPAAPAAAPAPTAPASVVPGKTKAVFNPARIHNRSVSQPIPQPQIVVQSEPTPEPAPEQAARQGKFGDALTKAPSLGPLLTEVKSNGSGSQSPHTPIWMRRSSDASDIRPLPMIATGKTTPRRGSKDDATLSASRALLKTPFSGVSMQSSASGFYEVHEATAVNIYPHTNSSLLVIQQQSSDEPITFPVHPAVRPGAYRLHEITSPTSPSVTSPIEEEATPVEEIEETVHVTVSGPNGGPIITRTEVPVRTVGSPLRNPRPAPSPQKASYEIEEILPAVNLIPPTPLEDPVGAKASAPAPANKTALVSGPVALVRRALSNRRTQGTAAARSSGNWLGSGRRNAKEGSVQKRKSRPTVSDNNLSPFWKPKRFWDDSEGSDSADEDDLAGPRTSEGRRKQFYQLGSKGSAGGKNKAAAGNDYFGGLPVRNTLGFPQQRTVISGPASLVRRLSSIRRRRTAVQTAWSDPKLNPSLRSSGSSKPPATLPQPGAGSSTNLTATKAPSPRASPSPSAMERRRKANVGSKRQVRFEFNPMRGFAGGSGESKEWRTKGMVQRLKDTRDQRRHERDVKELERIEKRRRELRGLISRPQVDAEGGEI